MPTFGGDVRKDVNTPLSAVSQVLPGSASGSSTRDGRTAGDSLTLAGDPTSGPAVHIRIPSNQQNFSTGAAPG
jgi:hypothetical protein